jgi:hypothetical protein
MARTNHPAADSSSLSRSDDPRMNADPPAASGRPLQGQVETNQPQDLNGDGQATEETHRDGEREQHPAYQFAWQAYLQYGRAASTGAATFEALEPQLERMWHERQKQKASSQHQPWQEAREIARDAWRQVQDAMSGQ